MDISVHIDTSNAAFEDEGAGREVARILRKLAAQIEDWPGKNEWTIRLRDVNGNTVGTAEATE